MTTITLTHQGDSSLAGQVQTFNQDRVRLGRRPDNDVTFDVNRDRAVSGHVSRPITPDYDDFVARGFCSLAFECRQSRTDEWAVEIRYDDAGLRPHIRVTMVIRDFQPAGCLRAARNRTAVCLAANRVYRRVRGVQVGDCRGTVTGSS